MFRRRCRNRQHIHFCRRHGRHYHLSSSHHHHHHSHRQQLGVPQPKPFGQRTVIAPKSRMDPPKERTSWEDNDPDSLLDICAKYLLLHPEAYCVRVPKPPCHVTPSSSSTADGEFDIVGAACAALREDPDSSMESPPPGTPPFSAYQLTYPSHPLPEDAPASLRLMPDLHLPLELCERMFSVLQEEGLDLDDALAEAFSNTDAARLQTINVRGTSITDRGLRFLLKHRLRDLDIHHCVNLTERSLDAINQNSDSLLRLYVGDTVDIFPSVIVDATELNLEDQFDDEDSLDEEDRARCVYDTRGYILRAPKLQSLSLHQLRVQRGPHYFHLLLRPLPNLTHLDLTGMVHHEGVGDMNFLRFCPNLLSLVLHNVVGIHMAVNTLKDLRTLRHLDISQNDDKLGIYDAPNKSLSTLVENLVNLTSLDISGTNLGGTGVHDAAISLKDIEMMKDCDIPGLVTRVGRPLEFLGLYKTCHEAACRQHIPAAIIAGDANERQIMSAGKQYLERPVMLENVLNDLFHVFRFQNCSDLRTALDIILMAMDKHPKEKIIQISGSASLYYIVKNDEFKDQINLKMKKKILGTLLNGMFAHKSDSVMMRNGCLTLCQFSIPKDVIFDYERLVRILLQIVSEHSQDEADIVQTASIYLLNSLACHVNRQQKLLVGNLGAMETMLAVVKNRVDTEYCDTVMETAWSCMWNVTDETPHNCKRFLDGGGMNLFLRCKEKFPSKTDLLRNMMGLLGNVAEVPALRCHLMTKEFVEEFTQLLDSQTDGIEVSYNAAGVLAHMVSDGADAWTVPEPSRAFVLSKMVSAVNRWNLQAKRNINYRSFEPILRLVRVDHTPECQLWAAWALANLSYVDRRYCALVEKEGGLTLLEEIINRNVLPMAPEAAAVSSAFPRVIELAQHVRENVARYHAHLERKRLKELRKLAGEPVSEDEKDEDDHGAEQLDYDG